MGIVVLVATPIYTNQTPISRFYLLQKILNVNNTIKVCWLVPKTFFTRFYVYIKEKISVAFLIGGVNKWITIRSPYKIRRFLC